MTVITLFFAGLWHLIWDWVLGFGIVGVLLFAALGTQLIAVVPVVGPWIANALRPLRVDLLWAAAGVTAALVWGAHMQKDEAARCVAKETVISTTVDKAGKKAVEKPRDPSRWETNQ